MAVDKDFFRDLFQPKNKDKKASIFMIFMLGVALLLFGSTFSSSSNDKNTDEYDTNLYVDTKNQNSIENSTNEENSTKKQLEDILSKVKGAGEVEVFITYASTTEKVVAQNTSTEKNYNENREEVLQKEDNEVVLVDTKDGTIPYVLVEQSAKVEGVMVVAQGGNIASVRQELHSGVQAVFNVDAHKIVILGME